MLPQLHLTIADDLSKAKSYKCTTMTSMLDRLLAADIPDPTDFPDNNAAPGLRSFDEAVRCTICRDFYDAPVTLTCGHCFCSAVRKYVQAASDALSLTKPTICSQSTQCIRSALPEHQNCPTCRKPASEVHIRKDVAMETAVQAWQAARCVYTFSRKTTTRQSRPSTQTLDPTTLPRRRGTQSAAPSASASSSEL